MEISTSLQPTPTLSTEPERSWKATEVYAATMVNSDSTRPHELSSPQGSFLPEWTDDSVLPEIDVNLVNMVIGRAKKCKTSTTFDSPLDFPRLGVFTERGFAPEFCLNSAGPDSATERKRSVESSSLVLSNVSHLKGPHFPLNLDCSHHHCTWNPLRNYSSPVRCCELKITRSWSTPHRSYVHRQW